MIRAKSRFQFAGFNPEISPANKIIWRHDIDFSPQRAFRMAEMEKEQGILSTYFVLLHSEFYNLLESSCFKKIKMIGNLGHTIGLHFDPHFYNIDNEKDLKYWLQHEKDFLEKLLHQKIAVFSFHITNSFTESCRKISYSGMINVYADFFRQNYSYCSDSNGYWRFRRLNEVLEDTGINSLQVLTHPELWSNTIQSPRERVMRCIQGRANYTKQWYENVLKVNKRKNIDWQ